MGPYSGQLERECSGFEAIEDDANFPLNTPSYAPLKGWRLGWLRDPETGAHWTGFHHV